MAWIAFRDGIWKGYDRQHRLCVQMYLKVASQKSIVCSHATQLLYAISRHCHLLKCV